AASVADRRVARRVAADVARALVDVAEAGVDLPLPDLVATAAGEHESPGAVDVQPLPARLRRRRVVRHPAARDQGPGADREAVAAAEPRRVRVLPPVADERVLELDVHRLGVDDDLVVRHPVRAPVLPLDVELDIGALA